jgi:ribosomal RNA-processing protein 12
MDPRKPVVDERVDVAIGDGKHAAAATAVTADDVARVLEFPSTPDSGVRAGLRCLAHLISAGDKSSWEAVEPLYAVVLRLATDQRLKVLHRSST